MGEGKDWKLRALTDVWTGDIQGKNDRLIPTSIMGSLRWWYEVLVRGLGGAACDPTAQAVRCPDKEGKHCVACELFGCTGWARKFRLMIVDENDQVIQNQIQSGQTFILRFIPLRTITPEEWCLLDATLRLIADYGALGGKTVFKPSDEWGIADLGESDLENVTGGGVKVKRSRRGLPLQNGDIIREINGQTVHTVEGIKRVCAPLPHGTPVTVRVLRDNQFQEKEVWAGKRHHQDLGLIQVLERPDGLECKQGQLKAYVQDGKWRKKFDDSPFAWASLRNFWCVKGRYLARQNDTQSSFNRALGRRMEKNRAQQLFRNTDVNRWLAGSQQESQQESKKVFSFKEPQEARRTFGFVKPGLVGFEDIKKRLYQAWQNENFDVNSEFLTGEQILEQLFR